MPGFIARWSRFVEAIQADSTCPAMIAKIFLFSFNPNHFTYSDRPASSEGRFAIVTNVRRDAVDADGALTNAPEADGEAVWSRRPDAGVKLAEVIFADDGGKKARSPRRARNKP
jgi:hypothetical protein